MFETDLESPRASVIDDPMVRDLAERMARHQNVHFESALSRLGILAEKISAPAMLEVARQPFEEDDLVFAVVKGRVRAYANNRTPRWASCTAGVTSLEIAPNGLYGRCPKTVVKKEILGDIRDAGPLKVLRLARDELGCDIPCHQLMCFHNNVLRGTDEADFARRIGQQGLRGVYQPERRGYYSKMFIRWKMTDVCNYTCAYCCDWRTVNARGLELTDDEIMVGAEKIVNQFGAISMRLTGGEPSARRCYVDMMRLFHDNLDRFTDLEIRTNLSFQTKHQEVLSWDWNGKLHLHIGCHLRDKNFMPWRMVEVLKGAPNADYVLKFVAMPSIRPHVQFFTKYFLDSGIPYERIKVIEEHSARDGVYGVELEEAPKARKYLEEQAAKSATATADADARPDGAAAQDKPVKKSTELTVTRLSIDDLRALKRRSGERKVISADVEPPPAHAPLPGAGAVPPAELAVTCVSNSGLRTAKRNGERKVISADIEPPPTHALPAEAGAALTPDLTPTPEMPPGLPAEPTPMTQVRRVIVGLSGPNRIAFSARVVRALVRRAKARIPHVSRPTDGHSARMGS
ncbi:MAG TPA: radical SAM protein [Rhizomicrobium sp.]|nr:radical SAM protein [Rhizomicrobium sp.]